jgi:hypothetical protein
MVLGRYIRVVGAATTDDIIRTFDWSARLIERAAALAALPKAVVAARTVWIADDVDTGGVG